MKTILAVISVVTLTACGIETASTAATVATMKKQEMDQAKADLERAKQKIEQTNVVIQERADQSDPDKTKE
jgi:hypothetical protein